MPGGSGKSRPVGVHEPCNQGPPASRAPRRAVHPDQKDSSKPKTNKHGSALSNPDKEAGNLHGRLPGYFQPRRRLQIVRSQRGAWGIPCGPKTTLSLWALLLKGQKGGGQSGQSRVIEPSTITTLYGRG